MLISGYPAESIISLLSSIEIATPAAITTHIGSFKKKIDRETGPFYLSLGENCGPGFKIKESGLPRMGAGFFDNIVCPIESVINIINDDFSEILRLRNLRVGEWEGNDSVIDDRYNIYFHHYFYLRGENEKRRIQDGISRRAIDDIDIPMFLPFVVARFEFMAEKFRVIMRSSCSKILLFRYVFGHGVETAPYNRLKMALDRFGAINYDILIIHSELLDPLISYPREAHRLITQSDERWGSNEEWKRISY